MTQITCQTVIEILGKPKEHIEKTLRRYIEKIKSDEKYDVKSVELAEVKKQEEGGLWACFAEIKFSTNKVENLVSFCFDYMPSIIEVIEPKELHFSEVEVSHFLNDLQAKLHQVDMVAKQLNLRNKTLQKNLAGLLKNYLLILLDKNSLTLDQLSKFTGVGKDQLGDYLDCLIDDGKVDLEGEIYHSKNKK